MCSSIGARPQVTAAFPTPGPLSSSPSWLASPSRPFGQSSVLESRQIRTELPFHVPETITIAASRSEPGRQKPAIVDTSTGKSTCPKPHQEGLSPRSRPPQLHLLGPKPSPVRVTSTRSLDCSPPLPPPLLQATVVVAPSPTTEDIALPPKPSAPPVKTPVRPGSVFDLQ